MQEKIVEGLMIKLDEVVQKQKKVLQNLPVKEVEKIVEKFDLKGKELKIEEIKNIFNQKIKETTLKEEQQKLISEAQILMTLAVKAKQNKNAAKPKKEEFILKDEKGNILKKIKTNKDGIIDEDEIVDQEQVQTKTKIG